MRHRILVALAILAALAAATGLPWLAWREAERQAGDAEADMTLGYARDVLHRADKTSRQVWDGIEQLERSGEPPCSAAAQEAMRDIDLSFTYIQAIGHVQGDAMLCSSASVVPIPLGHVTFHTSSGISFYTNVPIHHVSGSLIAIRKGRFAALIHRDLLLDIGTAVPGLSLGVVYLERPESSPVELGQGHIDRRWVRHLGTQRSVIFVDGPYLVAVVRSGQFQIAGIAAVPLAQRTQRTHAIAQRLVPAGLLAGLALAAAMMLLVRQRLSLAAALRLALRQDEFFMEYQPIVELESGRWIGVEALIRWRRATGEMVGPDLFIPVAEQSGLIHEITERVLQLVEADAGQFLVTHPGFHVGVNVSPADLQSDSLVPQLDAFLARTGACAANLIIEITERGFLDLDKARGTVAALHSRGFAIAIDDFGTGYSSLSYLESLEVDFLKIDRAFIEAIGTRAPTSRVVGHIIAMANGMDLRMIAEGIERPAQADFLVRHNVQFAQGWLYGKPMPFETLAQALAERNAADIRAAASM